MTKGTNSKQQCEQLVTGICTTMTKTRFFKGNKPHFSEMIKQLFSKYFLSAYFLKEKETRSHEELRTFVWFRNLESFCHN